MCDRYLGHCATADRGRQGPQTGIEIFRLAVLSCESEPGMLFSIDEDVGGRLEGWVMPDNPAVTPRIIVHLNSENHVVIEAFVFRPLLKQNGLHNTGICGFVLDENNCRGLTAAGKLEIYDADNHLLIYRRKPSAGLIDKKFFRLEPQLFRSVALDDALLPHFHMAYPALELISE